MHAELFSNAIEQWKRQYRSLFLRRQAEFLPGSADWHSHGHELMDLACNIERAAILSARASAHRRHEKSEPAMKPPRRFFDAQAEYDPDRSSVFLVGKHTQ